MQLPGKKLREAREALRLRYRDVEQASHRIASSRGNLEFVIGLSRLADIENKGTIPTVYRLYSLCVIYRLEFSVVLAWYGISLGELPADAAQLSHDETHLIGFEANEETRALLPEFASQFDPSKTSFLTRQIRAWGRVPVSFLSAADPQKNRYGFVGDDDYFMYPILFPGSFVQIDETKRRVAKDGWFHENERPIYFVEHRGGHSCAWCTEQPGLLILQPHSASGEAAQVYKIPGEAEIIGQVVAVAMRLDPVKRRHTHF